MNLGSTPLANRLMGPIQDHYPDFPLALMRCVSCSHLQLSGTVDPELLYRDQPYPYLSGQNPSWKAHCEQLVPWWDNFGTPTAIDVASNDGTMLEVMKAKGYNPVGFEPSSEFNKLHQYRVFNLFFNEEVAKEYASIAGQATLVVAQNVLGHVADPVGFLRGIRCLLGSDGLAVVEVPLLDPYCYDTIYHEHLSYWTKQTLEYAATLAGLYVVHTSLHKVHGLTIRVQLKKAEAIPEPITVKRPNVPDPCIDEMYRTAFVALKDLAQQTLRSYQKQGLVVWGYGASAKGNTWLSTLPKGTPLPIAILDNSPAKQGKYTPHGVPIVAPQDLTDCDRLLILAWNWFDDIKVRAKALGFKGKYILTPTMSEHV